MPAASLKAMLMGSTFIILAFLPLTLPPFVHDLTPLMISSHKLGILKDRLSLQLGYLNVFRKGIYKEILSIWETA